MRTLKIIGIGVFVTLFLTGLIITSMGDLNGVCISCAYEHGYGWQVENAQRLQVAGVVITVLAFAALLFTVFWQRSSPP